MPQEGHPGAIPGVGHHKVEGLQEEDIEVELGEVIMEEMTVAMTVTQQGAHSHSQTPLIAIVALKPSRELCKRMDQTKEESSLFVENLGMNNATFSNGQISQTTIHHLKPIISTNHNLIHLGKTILILLEEMVKR